MKQGTLDEYRDTLRRFNGADYDHERDSGRLSLQLQRVFNALKDGQWNTLEMLASKTGDPEASISAQMRHLRKNRFGAYIIEKRYVTNGLYEYRLLVGADGKPIRNEDNAKN